MAEVAFIVKFNKKALALIKKAPDLTMNRMAEEIMAKAIQFSPHKTGTNRRSIRWDTGGLRGFSGALRNRFTRRIFGTSGYSGLLELGTGIFGPKKRRITPKRKKALHWGGDDGPVVRSVEGIRPRPYFRPALFHVTFNAERILKNAIDESQA